MKMKTTLKTLVFSLALVNSLYSQRIPYGQEFLVNTCTYSWQELPTAASLSNGAFVVCWVSREQDGSGYGIFGQLFDDFGNKIGNEFQINTFIEKNQDYPCVAALSDGGYIVCWISFHSSHYGVFGQIFNASGDKRGQEFQMNNNTINEKVYQARVAGLKDSGFVLCWTSDRLDTNASDIFGQLFDALGNKKGNEFYVNTYKKSEQFTSNVTGLINGGFVVCWVSDMQDGSSYGVFGQVFDASGEKKGAEFQINTYYQSVQYMPNVAPLEDGSFVVCWVSYGQDGDGHGVFCRLVKNQGVKIGDEFQVNTYILSHQDGPKVSPLAHNGYVICWNSHQQDGSRDGIYGQLFDSFWKRKGCEFRVNSYTENDQVSPQIVPLKNGDFVVCWQSDDQDGSFAGIYGKYFLNEPIEPIVHQLKEFSLIEPSNDQTLNTTQPLFKWRQPSSVKECYSCEMTFDVYLDTDINFSNPQVITNIQDTTYRTVPLALNTTYFWKVLAKNLNGDSLWSQQQNWGFFIKQAPSSLEISVDGFLRDFVLQQNYPNPFNSSTSITYMLPQQSQVTLKIFNLMGQDIKTLVDKPIPPVNHTVLWDSKDNFGNQVASGIYFYQLQAGDYTCFKKMAIIK